MRIEKNEVPVSERLDDVVEKKLNVLYREQKIRRIRNGVIGVSTAAACFMGVIVAGVANPAWASQLPIIGHIFEQMGQNMNYPGDYSGLATSLETDGGETEESAKAQENTSVEAGTTGEETQGDTAQVVDGQTEAAGAESSYVKKVGDMTVTLSEIYCNGQSLNIAIALQSDNPFPDTMTDFQKGQPIISCRTRETYSFNPSVQSDLVYLDGAFVDDYTFAGNMRFDLNLKNTDDTAFREAIEAAEAEGSDVKDKSDVDFDYEALITKVEVPEQFTLKLELDQIVGSLAEPEIRPMDKTEEELEAMSDDEWQAYMNERSKEDPSWDEYPNTHENYWFDGPWEFELEVAQNREKCVTVELNSVNEDGVGIEKIERTPVELTVYPIDERSSEQIVETGIYYMPVVLDADGMLMSTGGGGPVDTVAIGDHDVSRVDVYLFEDTVWLDEVKGYWWSTPEGLQKGETLEDGRTFKELCDERCVFHTEIEIPEE